MDLLIRDRAYVMLRKVLLLSGMLIVCMAPLHGVEKESTPVIASVNINSCVGSITISVTDGTAPYNYVWRNSGGTVVGGNSFFVDGLAPDDYSVTVTDNDGDAINATYTITNPPDLTGSVVVNDVTCRDNQDAQVIITMANGNPPYPWELFNDANGNQVQTGTGTTPIITLGGLGAGDYRFEVEDVNGCTGTITFTITEPANYLQYNGASVSDATCFNGSDGAININVAGGWGNYSYRWIRVSDNAVVATNQDATGLAPGQYFLEISDANPSGNPCIIITTNYTVGSPPEIVPTATINNALCNGEANGSINLSVSGGVGPYTYAWSNGATTQNISGLSAGNYTVTITDNSGCIDVETFAVGEPAVLTINQDIRDVACFGDNTGRIRSNVTGGTAPYTYSWSTGNTGRNLPNRTAGTYSLTVTDANGCTTTAAGLVISEPAAPISKASETLNSPSCFGANDGSITVAMSGGTAPYTYSWSNGDSGPTANGLSAGIYTVTVTDNSGCTYVENITLNDPVRIAINASLTPPSCNGLADGSLSVAPTNGTASYTYNWSTGDATATVNGVPAGTYSVTVTDAGGCSVTESLTLSQPGVLTGNATVNDITCSGANDGSIFLAVSGGSAPYSYSWADNGATSNNRTGLADGNYSVTITDGNGCSITENYTVNNPAPLTTSFTQTDLVCRGGSTGAIDITPSGGTAPYSYLWSNGATTQDVSNLTAGAYSVTIRDTENCNITLNITLTEPATVLSLAGSKTNATCNGSNNGSIDLVVTGGSAPYTYAWSNGAVTEDLNGLAPGNYNVSVTDNNGCTKFIDFTITQPAPLAGNATVTSITCNGAADGQIQLNPTEGTGTYTYAWADDVTETAANRTGLAPGNYTVTITDGNGCTQVELFNLTEPTALSATFSQANVSCFGESTGLINLTVSAGTAPYTFSWSNGAITEDVNALAAGNYSVVITDSRGCTITENMTITQPSSVLTVTGSASQITCNGAADGIINVTVSGGTAPYAFNWSNGSTAEDLNSLPAGTYNLTVTDNNGCTETASYTITDPPLLVLTGTTTDVTCNGANDGRIDVSMSGGEGPYTFAWSNGETTEDVTGLAPGTYSVNVTDSRGCSVNQTFTITQPITLNLAYTFTDVDCFGNSTGAIDITVTGGTAPYAYSWDTGSITEDLSGLNAGNYNVTVTDTNGCSIVESITISQPVAVLVANGTPSDISCFGGSDGSVVLNPTGGTAPYTYSWNNGETTKDVFGLSVGTYQVTVRDFNGCAVTETYTIAMPPALQVSGVDTDIVCHGVATGAIDLTVSGGTTPYTFTWSNGETTEDVSGLSAGNYQVTVVDASGCTQIRNFEITQPLALNLVSTVNDVTCFGAADGNVQQNVSGGVAPYAYSWSNGETTKDIFNLVGGTYTVTITDGNGCITTQEYTVNEPVAALVASGVVTDERCFGDNQGAIDLTISGGSSPYTIAWNQGATTEDIAGLSQGIYQVNVRDANNCTVVTNFTVGGPSEISVSAIVEDVTCNGNNDGTIDISPVGGVGPYTYSWSNGETTEDLTALPPGAYAVTVTDANGCSTTHTYTIQEPLSLVINEITSNVSCFGAADGSIDVTVSGGNLPYSYAWSNGATTQDLSGLDGGSYQLMVTDNKGCQITKDIIIQAPVAALDASVNIIDVTCNGQPGGQIQVTPTGGTAPYTYAWSNGSNQEDQGGLFAGDYALTITDSQGCTFSGNYTVAEPEALSIQFDVAPTSCFGAADGRIKAVVTGGQAPYNFVWSNGGTTPDQFDLAAGTYNLTVIDANGCSINTAAVVGESSDLKVQVKKRDVLCKGASTGLIELDVSGGSGVYSYTWDNGGNSAILNDLNAGLYNVVISDQGGCTTTASVVITEPAQALTASVSGTDDLVCFGEKSGLLQVAVQGGIAPYTYVWSNGERTSAVGGLGAGTYTVSVTDANACLVQVNYTIAQPDQPITIETNGKLNLDCAGDNDGRISVSISGGSGNYDVLWSTGDTGTSITNLAEGDYTIRVRDEKGCVEERVFTVSEPNELTLGNAIVNESQCYNDRNGSIEINVNGGTTPYTYQWSNGETTKNIIGISSGAYSVLVTDANGCQVQGNFNLASPELFQMNPVVEPISCIGAGDASIALNIEGGIEPVTIQWSTGARTETISNLTPGQYNVLVTDTKGCTLQQVFNIVNPTALSLDAFILNADACNQPESGRVNLIVSGGTKPYSYRWSNGATSSTIEDVLPGTYVVEVSDAFGCTQQGTYTVLQPEPLQIGFSSQPFIDCENRIAGVRVLANVKGGLGNYSYSWSRGESNTSEMLLTTSGRLTLEITDGRGCFQMNSIDIDIPELGEADYFYNALSLDETGELAIKDPVSFFDESIGEIIDWQWDFGDGFESSEVDPIHVYDAPGQYEVVLTTTDRTGCTSEKRAVLDLTKGYEVIIPNAFTPNGDGNNDFFRPEMRGLTEVQLIIFNTWGEVVWSTRDVESKGWDGFVNSKRVENGNYIYKMIGISFNGLKVERDGIFALLK